MRKTGLLAALLTLALAGSAPADEPTPSPWLSQPALAPDGREIAFVSGGDIWTVPAAGGEARLLLAHPADDRRPLYSPDGRSLAFVSDRTGNGDVYVMTLATGALRRLTFDDGVESPDAWSADGTWIYFSSSTADATGSMNDVFRVAAAGGTPMPVSAERYTNEFAAAPSPDGRSLLLSARGMASAQWWRNGHSHIDESEIWLLREGAAPAYRRIVDRGAKALWPMWAPDGTRFYYMSDRGGTENLWSADLEGRGAQLTRFEGGRLLWPGIAADGRTIAFERDFGIWTFDTGSGQARPVPIALRGVPAGRGPELRRLTGSLQEMALSPDGKKIAFVVHGEVFAVSAADGGDATRVTRSAEAERHVAWAPDSRRLAFTSATLEGSHLFLHDFGTGQAQQLTDGPGIDVRPCFSPDGKSLAFVRGGRELRVIDLATKAERRLVAGYLDYNPPLNTDRPFVWSPDGRWIGFMAQDERLFRNASVVEVASGQSFPVSFLANVYNGTISWSPDGTSLFFDTSQRTEDGQVARVDLLPRTPQFREQQFRDLFKDEPKKDEAKKPGAKDEAKKEGGAKAEEPGKPAEIVRDGLRTRLTLLPVPVDVHAVTLSPDGKQLLMVADAAGTENLWLFPLDELSREDRVPKQLTSTDGAKGSPQFSPDGKTVYYLDAGGIVSIPVEGRTPKSLAVSAAMEVDFDAEKAVVFDQAWGWLRTHFHDPAMNGADWDEVRAAFAPRVAAERTPTELARLLSMMVGELDASHCGVRPAGSAPRTTGRIGLRFDRAEYERSGALRVAGLVPLGPAAVTRKIQPGDWLLAVDGVELTRTTALERLLENRIGKEVRLTLGADARGAQKREVSVLPVDQTAERDLIYREWVEKNRACVARLSGGRLGYVHMLDMGYETLLRLLRDLDSENMTREGVVFDVRNNNGGFVNAYALDVLARRHYLNMRDRGMPAGPARRVLGQRALEKPTVLVTNQHSLSDAEDFTEGYRSLGLGKVVGEPTAGWIIFTDNVTMLDGSVVRLPTTTITTAAGEPMEMHPRPVDVEVRRALGEDEAGKDSQLERAVTELLGALKK